MKKKKLVKNLLTEQERERKRFEELSGQNIYTTIEKYSSLEKLCPKGIGLIKPKENLPLIPKAQAHQFYASSDWEHARAITLAKYGRKCMCCGETEEVVQVDHIKPLRLYWELRLDFDNLQVLCDTCNFMKGNWCSKDFRYTNARKSRNLAFYTDRLNQYARQQIALFDGSIEQIVVEQPPKKPQILSFRGRLHKFYHCTGWKILKKVIFQRYGKICMCCGADESVDTIWVDHIKPLEHYWGLRWDPDNLQVLCRTCDAGKGDWDMTDFRPRVEQMV